MSLSLSLSLTHLSHFCYTLTYITCNTGTFGINGHGILFQLLPTIERIQQVVLAVPRMQGFVRDICYTLRVDPATTLGVAMELGNATIHQWEKSMVCSHSVVVVVVVVFETSNNV